ncbi:hypothetical protein [Paraburkholderia sp. J8-2]|uniref:hypothetical protein n=1 Tax=Paraburkholderia sp. J8-2 TaxID=2805440 RepID=UPI002AB720B3|nr:hypothetical protein [Paraburkholderia sp. J8-2]
MQALRSTLGKIEAHSRAVAIAVTALVVLAAVVRPYAGALARYYLDEAGGAHPQFVMKPGYTVLIDGQATPVFGVDECPLESDPSKAYWLGGRPDDIPLVGCIVVGPETKEVRVRVRSREPEVWKVVHQERDGFPVTLVQRPNGDLVTEAK